MQKRHFIGLLLAATVATAAGCASPAQTGQAATSPSATKLETRTGAAQALATEQELGDYDAMAEASTASRYDVLAIGGPKPRDGEVAITGSASGEAKAEHDKGNKPGFKGKLKDEIRVKLEARKAQVFAKSQARFDKHKEAKNQIQDKAKRVAWVDNGDGTETQSYSFSVTQSANGKTFGRSVEMKRVRNKETKDLLSAEVKTSESNPAGFSRSATRSRTLNEDGSYTVVFHAEETGKDGAKRVADWTKTIALDGKVSGTGTIVWTDKDGKVTKTVNVGLNGTEEAPAADAGGETVTPEAAAPEASASPEASPSPEASASPEATATAAQD